MSDGEGVTFTMVDSYRSLYQNFQNLAKESVADICYLTILTN